MPATVPRIHTGTGAAGRPRISPHFRKAASKGHLEEAIPAASSSNKDGWLQRFVFFHSPSRYKYLELSLEAQPREINAVLTQSIAAWDPPCASQRPGRHDTSVLPCASVLIRKLQRTQAPGTSMQTLPSAGAWPGSRELEECGAAYLG